MAGRHGQVQRLASLAIVVAFVSLAGPVGCDSADSDTEEESGESGKKRKKNKGKAGAQASGSALASAATSGGTAPAAVDASGPMLSIPDGKLHAGSRCYDVPRVRPNELVHDEMAMSAFEIDKFPYPNSPGQPAKLGVTWQRAQELCEARGKRLCTELEWERACKGPKSATYMWGPGFKKAHCDGRTDHLTDQRPECKTAFDVMDMMGLSLEWTASDWERGSPNGQKVVRGARAEKVSWLSARCAHSRQRDPNKSHDNVGFRCCKGPENTAKVQLRLRQHTSVEEDLAIDTEFEMTLMRAMKKDHRGITDVRLSFDKVYRWHPVPNEEMIVARWKGEPDDSAPFYEMAVFKLCGHTAYRAMTMRGPVEWIGRPKMGTSSTKLTFDVSTGKNKGRLQISYWHGYVKFTEPAFVKKGNQLKVKKTRRATPKRRRALKARPR